MEGQHAKEVNTLLDRIGWLEEQLVLKSTSPSSSSESVLPAPGETTTKKKKKSSGDEEDDDHRRELQTKCCGVGLPAFNKLKTRVANAESKIQCIHSSSNRKNVYFRGCNVHVQNGRGRTNSKNRYGNLIVGTLPNCTPSLDFAA